MIEIQREVPDSMLAQVIYRVVHGEAAANEVTSVLRRVAE